MGEPCFLQIARPGRPERLFRIEPGVYPIGSDAENPLDGLIGVVHVGK